MKINLLVPEKIIYLSQWSDFSLQKFQGHNILHKQLPGCGFTEFALTCSEPVVLCSPRRMLMQNKKDQHGDDVYLVINEYEIDSDIDEDISKPETLNTSSRKTKEFLISLQEQLINKDSLYSRLYNEIYEYIGRMNSQGKPIKIIVTYDSTYLVKQILEAMQICDSFYFCVDEFQSILEDSRFKSSVELEFLTTISSCRNVLFVSATPMLDKYLFQIDEFKNLPYYELDWGALDPIRIKRPNIDIKAMSSVGSEITRIIQTYLDGKFKKVIVKRDNQLVSVESKEAVFYVNSVNHIVSAIKKMNLIPDQCNILCSDTSENQSKINKKLGKKSEFRIGRVPLKGEAHKMFTFCTRTVYLGADFYSTNARSFIFSDANYDSLSVDISMDLAQIMGRQRLEENPWRNTAEFYYRSTCDYRKMTWEDLNNVISKKLKNTKDLLDIYNITPEEKKELLAQKYLKDVNSSKYHDDYVAVNRRIGNSLVPVFNNLVMINEQRAFDIQQVDYKDRFSIFNSINREINSSDVSDICKNFYQDYDQLSTYVDKIHMIVDYLILHPEHSDIIIGNLSDSDKIKQQLITLGPERIKGLSYNITKIKKALGITIFDKSTFIEEIYSKFIPGERYTKRYIKETLGNIYSSADFDGTPKATDLEEWFEIKLCKISINGKQVPAFEILKINKK